jgi:hypothetical protein
VSAPRPADRQALDAILERAAVDREFRQQLVGGDWRRSIQQSFGIAVPGKFVMRFVERDPGVDALIVLPDFKNADGELADHELEAVAGGADPTAEDPWW